MNKYLQAILVFDFALPALFVGLPCFALVWATSTFQTFVQQKTEENAKYEAQSLQVSALRAQMQPMQAKVALLEVLLSGKDIESRLGDAISASLEKLSSDDIAETLHDFQFGPSAIGANFGEGQRLSLKFSSRWQALNSGAAEWETRFPNMVLETLSIDPVAGSAVSAAYLQSSLSYFVITEK